MVNYLKASDLWEKKIYDNEDFDKNLNELKSINVQINQTISLYEALGKDIENDFFEDVKQKHSEQMKKKENEIEDIFEEKEDSESDNERDED